MSVLAEILTHKRSELADRQRRTPLDELRRRAERASPALDFTAALAPHAPDRVRLIAEVKKASPSAGVLNAGLDPVAQARTYADAGAAAISVLTDEKYFRGHVDDLVQVRAAVTVPLLRKEFIVDEYQLWESRAAGADAVLLIVAALEREALRDLVQAAKGVGLATLVEVHDAPELDIALSVDAPVIGVNNRDLRTFAEDLGTTERLAKLVPADCVLVAESSIKVAADAERMAAAGAHAVLVGEALVTTAGIRAKAHELMLVPSAVGGAS